MTRSLFASTGEAFVHTLTVVLAILVLGISVAAYRKIGGRRYLLLVLGFSFMAMSQLEQFFESYFLSGYVYIPYADVHVSHLLDLAMLGFFGAALLVN